MGHYCSGAPKKRRLYTRTSASRFGRGSGASGLAVERRRRTLRRSPPFCSSFRNVRPVPLIMKHLRLILSSRLAAGLICIGMFFGAVAKAQVVSPPTILEVRLLTVG